MDFLEVVRDLVESVVVFYLFVVVMNSNGSCFYYHYHPLVERNGYWFDCLSYFLGEGEGEGGGLMARGR